MMRTKNASRQSHVAQPSKYAWVAAATLFVALMLAAFAASPRALANDAQAGEVPFGLQSGLVTAHLDPFGRVIGNLDAASLPFGLQSGLVTAHLNPSGQVVAPFALTGGTGLPFGLQSGLVTAHLNPSGQVVAPFALSGGTGLPFGLQSGLVTAYLNPNGQVTAEMEPSLGGDASSARWAALGAYHVGRAEPGRGRANAADSARWVALGAFYAPAAAALPYTDVSMFYAERMRVQPRQAGVVAANPELAFARGSYRAASDLLAASPELMLARRSYTQGYLACMVGTC